VIATKKVDVPANGRATVELCSLSVGYGFNRCAVRIDGGDAFPADDASVFAVRRSDPERVLFVHAAADPRSRSISRRRSPLQRNRRSFCNRLLRSRPQISILQSSRSSCCPIHPRCLQFLNTHLLSTSRKAAMCFSHWALLPLTMHRFFFGAARQLRLTITGAAATRPHVGQVDFSYPALEQAQPGRDDGGWSEVKVYYAVDVDPANARVAARLSDGTPLDSRQTDRRRTHSSASLRGSRISPTICPSIPSLLHSSIVRRAIFPAASA
jgi:hypothetical protein